jgi:hypothetical protein
MNNFNQITDLSAESEQINGNILTGSAEAADILNRLKGSLTDLTEIVKKPIEGSAANIERGARIEKICSEIIS